jgi:hypothetical protein
LHWQPKPPRGAAESLDGTWLRSKLDHEQIVELRLREVLA